MGVLKIKSDKERIKDTVLVLLSSYNGEKYIREQLDSLFNQTMPVFILVRDDGSSDNTSSIIHEYMEQHDNLKLIEGENLGFVGSFNALICNELTDKYEWIAFCDQDDVWLPEKLSAAVDMIKKDYDSEIPTLYCSNLTVTDEKLKRIKSVYNPIGKRKMEPILNHYFGCTFLFNHASVVLYKYGINDSIYAHDKQMHCVCYYFGRIIFDDNSYILYRQHGSNAIGYQSKNIFRAAADLTSELFKPHQSLRTAHFREFQKAYDKYLPKGENKFLQIFIDHEHSFIDRLILFFDPRFSSNILKETVSFKVRALINRMI